MNLKQLIDVHKAHLPSFMRTIKDPIWASKLVKSDANDASSCDNYNPMSAFFIATQSLAPSKEKN